MAEILIFARAPVPGACKSRLARGIGTVRAARVYRAMLIQTVETAVGAGAMGVHLVCAPDTRHPLFHQLRRRFGCCLHRQPRGDLGQRMHRALAGRLRRGAGLVLLVGSDCPSLTVADLDDALAALNTGHDAVLGPTEDGGYALVGLRSPAGRLFRGVTWSTPRVIGQTRHRLRRLGWRWQETQPLADVDHPRDWYRARRAGWLDHPY
ncbi:unnamed protein product [Chrysoparadoxa australica]